jgi:hypothetical protein
MTQKQRTPKQPSQENNESFKHHTGRYDLYQPEFFQPKTRTQTSQTDQQAYARVIDEERRKYIDGEPRQYSAAELRSYMPRHGRTTHRALDQRYVSRSAFHNPGAFGRMFPTLPAIPFTDVSLESLASAMGDASGGEDNAGLPAGFTFLGQFIDHDITFDPTSSLEKQNDPEAIHNFRTPVLELDNLYGSGPATQPFLYDSSPQNIGKFLIGQDAAGQPNDLPRNRQGTALIGDPRNDENLIVSQLHLAFLKFHNRTLDHLKQKGGEGGEPVEPEFLFEETQRVVRWHYQWIVVHEFLRKTLGETLWGRLLAPEDSRGNGRGGRSGRTVGQDPIGNVLDESLEHYRWKEEPFIPVEFAVAAYRFGHSQVRPGYRINASFGGAIFPDLSVRPNLSSDNVLAAGRTVDWSLFFDLGGTAQPGKKIDARISSPLLQLPGFTTSSSLPERNLKRGNSFSLPWGQRVASAMHQRPLSDEQLAINGVRLTELGFPPRKAPLWYYILKEAEVTARGAHMGPVGGRIIGEVFLGLLKGDFKSYLNQDPDWKPFLPAASQGSFTIADLIRFAMG